MEPAPSGPPSLPEAVLVGGFGSPAVAVRGITPVLEQAGFRTSVARLWNGLNCAEASARALAAEVAAAATRSGRPVLLVAHSRGGQFARVAAVREPGTVAGLVTLGTPFRHMGVRAPVLVTGTWVALLGSLGVPNLARVQCAAGRCCKDFVRDLAAPWPARIPFLAVRARGDRIVHASTCCDPAAECVEVRSSHAMLPRSRHVHRAVAEFLARVPARHE